MPARKPIRVLVAEDDALIRDLVVELVEAEADMELSGAVVDADEAIALAREARPDIALLDVRMPGGGGPRAAREIRRVSPGTRIVVLSALGDRTTVDEMLRAGAVSYLLKGTSVEEIVEAIRRVAEEPLPIPDLESERRDN
ncbi:MAG TPA: response regulator transcription factor [Actinomycetota bacterium]|nr:response regulator transcription factor [Actinomycetota bacterium]